MKQSSLNDTAPAIGKNTFSDFYDKYSPAVYGYIRKVIIIEDISNALLIEVFKQAWESRSKFKGSELSEILKIARKETNKQRINIILKQVFASEKPELVTV